MSVLINLHDLMCNPVVLALILLGIAYCLYARARRRKEETIETARVLKKRYSQEENDDA